MMPKLCNLTRCMRETIMRVGNHSTNTGFLPLLNQDKMTCFPWWLLNVHSVFFRVISRPYYWHN